VLLNGARAVARRAHLRCPDRTGSVARFAGVQPRDLQFLYAAANRVPEIDLELIFERAAFFGLLFHCAGPAAAKETAEEVAEACAAGLAAAEIEAAEIKVDVALATARSGAVVAGRYVFTVEAILVIHLALLGIRENVVGFLQLLEFLLGGFVAGIQIGMI